MAAWLAMREVVYFSRVISKNIQLMFWGWLYPPQTCHSVRVFGACGHGHLERAYIGRGLKQGSEEAMNTYLAVGESIVLLAVKTVNR